MSYFDRTKIVGITGNIAEVNDENQLHVVERGKVDDDNSTTTPLGIDGVFTGTAVDILDYSAISILVGSDVAGTLVAQFSPDGTDWHDGESYDIDAGAAKFFTPPAQSAYYRLVYTNGGTGQTTFFIHSILKKQAIKWSSHNIDSPITDQDDATLSKSVITGKDVITGNYQNINSLSVLGFNLLPIVPVDYNGIPLLASQMASSSDDLDGSYGLKTASGIYARISSTGAVRPVTADSSTHALNCIDYEHHEIHSGSEYRAGFTKDVPNGGTAIFAITTPNTTSWLHFKLAVDVESEALIMFYENPTSVTGGTAVTPRNANRNSVNTSAATVVTDPTINTTGATVLGNQVQGSGKTTGGGTASADEWVLKQNEDYVIVVTNQTTGNNNVNIRCRWYEHTSKN